MMNRRTVAVFTAALLMLFCLGQRAEGAVSWEQLTNRDSTDPNVDYVRPNISPDGSNVFYTHTCRTDDCDGASQDAGSVYRVNVATGIQTRILTGSATGGCNYVASDEDASELVVSCADNLLNDLAGDAATAHQVYILEKVGSSYEPSERLTAYQNPQSLKPNISANGRYICWVSSETPAGDQTALNAYIHDRNSGVTSAVTTSTDFRDTLFIDCANDGSYVVTSELELDLAVPAGFETDPNLYYWNGSSWQTIQLLGFDGTYAEPRITGDGAKIFFASGVSTVDGSNDGRRTAWVWTASTGLVTKPFSTDQLPETIIADFVSPASSGSTLAVSSLVDLDGGSASGQNVYIGEYTPSDLVVQSGSPVDIIVCDPLGRCISKLQNDIPGARYYEHDFNGDGDPDGTTNDRVVIDPRIEGTYTYQVSMEGSPSPGATYSLVASTNENISTLASNQLVPPAEPDTYQSPVPPPVALLTVTKGALRSRNGQISIRGLINAEAIAGNVQLTMSGDGGTPVVLNLGTISEWRQNTKQTFYRTTVLQGAVTARASLRKRRTGDWAVAISGRGLSVSYPGNEPIAMTAQLDLGSSQFKGTRTFRRLKNQDLVY